MNTPFTPRLGQIFHDTRRGFMVVVTDVTDLHVHVTDLQGGRVPRILRSLPWRRRFVLLGQR